MNKLLGIAAFMLFVWAFYVNVQDNFEAMEECQQTHSYDTCAYSILR